MNHPVLTLIDLNAVPPILLEKNL